MKEIEGKFKPLEATPEAYRQALAEGKCVVTFDPPAERTLRYVGTLWEMPIFEDPNKVDPPGWWLIETLREGAD